MRASSHATSGPCARRSGDRLSTETRTAALERPEPPPGLSPPPGHPRFPLVDGLRAIAALSVLLFHAATTSRASEAASGLGPYLARLNVGVAIFFAISGFLLYRPLLAARMGDGPPVRVRDYARRRALRIVPAYWVALTVLALYPGLPGVFTGDWLVYYGFTQGYSPRTIVNGIGPAWTLGWELAFYALLPGLSAVFARIARRGGRRASWPLELVVLGALAAAGVAYEAYATRHPDALSATFAGPFAWFATGMLLALASVLGARAPGRATAALNRFAWLGWPVALVAYWVICRGLGLQGGFVFLQRQNTAQTVAVVGLSGVLAAGLLLPAIFAGARHGPLGRLLASRPLAWLGLVSYGIYLYHEPLARVLNGGLASGGAPVRRFLLLAAGTAALAIAAGAVSYYVVERPALRLGKRRRGGVRP